MCGVWWHLGQGAGNLGTQEEGFEISVLDPSRKLVLPLTGSWILVSWTLGACVMATTKQIALSHSPTRPIHPYSLEFPHRPGFSPPPPSPTPPRKVTAPSPKKPIRPSPPTPTRRQRLGLRPPGSHVLCAPLLSPTNLPPPLYPPPHPASSGSPPRPAPRHTCLVQAAALCACAASAAGHPQSTPSPTGRQ